MYIVSSILKPNIIQWEHRYKDVENNNDFAFFGCETSVSPKDSKE